MSKGLRASSTALALVALLQMAPAVAADLYQVQALRDVGAINEAYQLALSLYDENAGDPAFDFVFSMVAMDADHPDEAVFALERIVFGYPKDLRARLELARAHFMLEDFQQAQEQFEIVLANKPPRNVIDNINQFLAAIKRSKQQQRSKMSYYIVTRVGVDSNINGASDQDVFELNELRIILDEESKENEDAFIENQIGFDYRHKMNNRAHAFIKGQFTDKKHSSQTAFDTGSYSVNFGMSFSYPRDSFSIPIEFKHNRLNRDEYYQTTSVGLEWTRLGGPQDQYKTFLQLGKHSYADDPLQSTSYFLGAWTWQHRLEAWPITISGTGLFSNEDARYEIAKHNGKLIFGALLGIQWQLTPRQLLFVGGDRVSTFYRDFNPTLGHERTDISFGANGGWVWRFADQFTFDLRGLYQKTNSNVSIYTIDRWMVSTGVRYDF